MLSVVVRNLVAGKALLQRSAAGMARVRATTRSASKMLMLQSPSLGISKGWFSSKAASAPASPPPQSGADYHGGCFCGKVRFELKGKPAFVTNCHCSVCRRCHSADYATLIGYSPSNLKVTKGEENLVKWVTGKEDRFSCKDCGSKVYSELNHLKHRAVFIPNIDGHGSDGKYRPELKATSHIFYGSGTISVRDGLPKYNTLPKAFGGDDKTLADDYHDKR